MTSIAHNTIADDLAWLDQHVKPAPHLSGHRANPPPVPSPVAPSGGHVPPEGGQGPQGLVPKQQSLPRGIEAPKRVRLPKDCPYTLVTLRNHRTGDKLILSSHHARQRRSQRRVKAWSDAMDVLIPESARRAMKEKRRVYTGPRMVMMTLTYADTDGWQANQIRDFMSLVKRNLKGALYGYAWVCEVQQRGAPHYHVLLMCKRGTRIPKPDDAGWWTHGSTKIETAKSPHYLVSYTSNGKNKEYQKRGLPKGARMYGVWIDQGAVDKEIYFDFRLSAIPGWLRKSMKLVQQAHGCDFTWKRVKGGGWRVVGVELWADYVFYSPWTVVDIEYVEPFETVELEE